MFAKAKISEGSAEAKENPAEESAESAGAVRKATARRRRAASAETKRSDVTVDKTESTSTLDVSSFISPADAQGSDVVRGAGNREMLVFAQEQCALLRRQEALFRQASAWLERIPESRREGVRQAVLVYARNVRAWQTQAMEQESAFLAAQDKDQQARARFILAEKAIAAAAVKPSSGWLGIFSAKARRQRAQVEAAMSQATECAAAVREALHDQGLAIHRYMRFQAEWRRSMDEMLAFVAEQAES